MMKFNEYIKNIRFSFLGNKPNITYYSGHKIIHSKNIHQLIVLEKNPRHLKK